MHLTAKAVITGSFEKLIFSEIYPVHSIPNVQNSVS